MIASEDAFVARRRADWDELERLLAPEKSLHRMAPSQIARAAALYRALSADLMHAVAMQYGRQLVTYLDSLAARGHGALYSAPPYRLSAVLDLVRRDFPATLRRHWRFLLCSVLLFLVPGVISFFLAKASSSFAVQVLDEATIESMEKAYSQGFDHGRAFDTDSMMAGFYVYNNVGIAFRCFATGILFGLGSVFFLVYNGVVTGAVAGAVTRAGHGLNLLTFCCTHSTLELTAIVISGAAGLLMGYSLVATRGRTRWGSLRANAKDLSHLISGAALFLLGAAAIEGFWSPSSLARETKWAAAMIMGTLVTLYLALAGRRRGAR